MTKIYREEQLKMGVFLLYKKNSEHEFLSKQISHVN